ncbi:MAG: hypothetical protein ACI9E4_000107 [Pseudohongiellaceae bacterium]|jgi:hypothetical protein
MKEQNWDETITAPAKLSEASSLLLAKESKQGEAEPKKSSSAQRTDVTELRRRIEERLEAKRISLEFDYEELENWSDSIQ